MARWASLVEQRRGERPVLLIDTGDFYPARPMANQEIKDRYFFKAVTLLRYDAIGIGEYETRNGARRIMEAVERRRLPFVSTNIMEKDSGKRIAAPFRIRTFGERRTVFGRTGGWRVGVFSVVRPEFVYGFGDNPAKDYYVVDAKIAALEAVNRLRGRGCSLIVAISHQGWDKSVELAGDVPGIDIVINAHWSHGLTYGKRVGKTLVIDPGQRETSFTEIEVTFKPNFPEIIASARCGSLLKNPGDPRFLKLEADFAKEMRAAQMRTARGGTAPGDTTKRRAAPVDTTRHGATAADAPQRGDSTAQRQVP